MDYSAGDRDFINPATGLKDGSGGMHYYERLTANRLGRVPNQALPSERHEIRGIVNSACLDFVDVQKGHNVAYLVYGEIDELAKGLKVSRGTVRAWFGIDTGKGGQLLRPSNCTPLTVCGLGPIPGIRPNGKPQRRPCNIRYDDTGHGDGDGSTVEGRWYMRFILAACLCNSMENYREPYDGAIPHGLGGLYRDAAPNCLRMRDNRPKVYTHAPYKCGTLMEAIRYISIRTDDRIIEVNEAHQQTSEGWVRWWISPAETYTGFPASAKNPKWQVNQRYVVHTGQDTELENPPTPAPNADTDEGIPGGADAEGEA